MRSAGLQSGDPPVAPSLPCGAGSAGARRSGGFQRLGRGGRGVPGARISRVLIVRSEPGSPSPPTPQPLRLLSEGCGGKFPAWAEAPLPGLAWAGPVCGPRGLSHRARLLALWPWVGAWGWGGDSGALHAIHPFRLRGDVIFQRRTASGREPVTRATRLWNWKKNSTLTATSLAAGA